MKTLSLGVLSICLGYVCALNVGNDRKPKVLSESNALGNDDFDVNYVYASSQLSTPLVIKYPGDKLVDSLEAFSVDPIVESEEAEEEAAEASMELLRHQIQTASEKRLNLVRQGSILEAKVALANLRIESEDTISSLNAAKNLINSLNDDIEREDEEVKAINEEAASEVKEHEKIIEQNKKDLASAKDMLAEFKLDLEKITEEMNALKLDLENDEHDHEAEKAKIDAIAPTTAAPTASTTGAPPTASIVFPTTTTEATTAPSVAATQQIILNVVTDTPSVVVDVPTAAIIDVPTATVVAVVDTPVTFNTSPPETIAPLPTTTLSPEVIFAMGHGGAAVDESTVVVTEAIPSDNSVVVPSEAAAPVSSYY